MEEEFVKYYDCNDLAWWYMFEKGIKMYDDFAMNDDIHNLNEAISLYNTGQYLIKKCRLKNWNDDVYNEYLNKKSCFYGKIAKYFNSLEDNNILEIYKNLDRDFESEFWSLFSMYKLFEKISGSVFVNMIDEKHTEIRAVLAQDNIRKKYDIELTKWLECANETIFLIIEKYVEGIKDIDFPLSFDKQKQKQVIRNYVENLQMQPSIDAALLCTSPNDNLVDLDIKVILQRRYDKYVQQKFIGRESYNFSFQIGCSDILKSIIKEDVEKKEIETIYNVKIQSKWLDDMDYGTVLQNFIDLFKFVNDQLVCSFTAVGHQGSTFEQAFSPKGHYSDYKFGHTFLFDNYIKNAEISFYINELKKRKIRFEDVLKWFFEKYLDERFGIKNFKYSICSDNVTDLERCKMLATEIDHMLKQYKLLLAHKEIDPLMLEHLSVGEKLNCIGSFVDGKYYYLQPNSLKLKNELFYLFSDRSMMNYTEKFKSKYRTLEELLKNEKVKKSDYLDVYQKGIDFLVKQGSVKEESGYLFIHYPRYNILRCINDYGVFNPNYCFGDIYNEFVKMRDKDELYCDSKLFAHCESEYLSFLLNSEEGYPNSLNLRNKYVHGAYSSDENVWHNDYITLLKVTILIVIKLNEEFCLKKKFSIRGFITNRNTFCVKKDI